MSDEHSSLDLIFIALANQHRRKIVYSLGLQPYSISKLALMLKLSLPAIHKHIKILEDADLIIRRKFGRSNYLSLNKNSLELLQNWLFQYQTHWGSNDASFENYEQFLKSED